MSENKHDLLKKILKAENKKIYKGKYIAEIKIYRFNSKKIVAFDKVVIDNSKREVVITGDYTIKIEGRLL